jgi:hypothetical protein
MGCCKTPEQSKNRRSHIDFFCSQNCTVFAYNQFSNEWQAVFHVILG